MSAVVLETSINDDKLDSFLRQIWIGRHDTDLTMLGPNIMEIWLIIKNYNDAVEMISSLFSALTNISIVDLVILSDRKHLVRRFLDALQPEEVNISLLNALLQLAYVEEVNDEALKLLYQITIKHLDIDLMHQISHSVSLDEQNIDHSTVLSELIKMKDWKWLINIVLNTICNQSEISHHPLPIESEPETDALGLSNMTDDTELGEMDNSNSHASDPETDSIIIESDFESDRDDRITNPYPHKIDIETIKLFLKERHLTKKSGEPLKKHSQHPDMSCSAVSYFERWRALLKRKSSFPLWKLDELIFEIMKASDSWNMNTASQNLSAISTLLNILTEEEIKVYIGSADLWNHLKELVQKQHTLVLDMKEIERDLQEMSVKEREILGSSTWVDFQQQARDFLRTYRMVDHIETKEQLSHMLHLIILRLYIIDHPPRRLEYLHCKWRNYDAEKENYYKDGEITLNDYKTDGTKKQYRIGVTEETRNIIEIMIQFRNAEDNDYIFGHHHQVRNPAFRTGMLNETFEIVFKKHPISVNILRKLWLEYLREQGQTEWTNICNEHARTLGHSQWVQQHVYKKRNREGTEKSIEEYTVEQPQKRQKKKSLRKRLYKSDEQEQALKRAIIRWRKEKGGRYKWQEMKTWEESLKDVPDDVVKNWGCTLVKSM